MVMNVRLALIARAAFVGQENAKRQRVMMVGRMAKNPVLIAVWHVTTLALEPIAEPGLTGRVV
jgi:hypothetical protein